MTMSAADFLDQWFETDPLKATMSASGTIRHVPGDPPPGTAYVRCTITWARSTASCEPGEYREEGRAQSARRSRAPPGRSAPRSEPRPPSSTSVPEATRLLGAVTSAGDEATGRVTLSSLDPRQTFGRLLPSGLLDGPFLAEVARYRYRGSSGKVNLALGRASRVHVPARRGRPPARRDQLQPEHRLHGAGLRRREVRSLQPASVHRHGHSDPGRPVDGASGQARHELLSSSTRPTTWPRATSGTTAGAMRSGRPSSTRSRSGRRTSAT